MNSQIINGFLGKQKYVIVKGNNMNEHKKTIITIWVTMLIFFIGMGGIVVMYKSFINNSLQETQTYVDQVIKPLIKEKEFRDAGRDPCE